jgi:hypothetical protein
MLDQLPSWETLDVKSLLPFARVRLIAVDLDGTVVRPSSSEVSSIRRQSRLLLQKYQVALTIATGRTLTGVRQLLDRLALASRVPLILYNGALVVRNTSFEVVLQDTISAETLQFILRLCGRYPVLALAYFYEDCPGLLSRTWENRERVRGWSSVGFPERDFNGMPIDGQHGWCLGDDASPSAIVIDSSHSTSAGSDVLAAVARVPDVSATRSGTGHIELRPKGTNKGRALQCVASFLGISRGEILALGDNDNDGEMLNWAGIGVAVAEASAVALSSSNYVCRHGVAEGAVELLRLVKQARRYFSAASTNARASQR